jgi:murein DD-endopeptidase MepM/ murein hydrolase activator NlpD
MDSYTVMIVPDHNAQVRRYRVSSRRVRNVLWASGIAALLVAVLAVDWVRARRDTRELEVLRAETATQRQQLEALSGAVGVLENRLLRVGELERKVRVIADLPAPADRAVAPPEGVGGEAEEEPLPALSPEEADLPPQPTTSDEPETSGEPQARAPGERAAHVAALQARARRLAALAESRERSLVTLVDGLQGKRRRLASTPSIWPTRGWVTSRFGYRTSPFTGTRQFHAGIDVAGRAGTPVVAPADGEVVFVGRKGPLGRTVILDHGYGIRTTFGHNSDVIVQRGQRVARGEKIAFLGSTGRSTGPHLHYAVQVDGRRVNPMNYILDE